MTVKYPGTNDDVLLEPTGDQCNNKLSMAKFLPQFCIIYADGKKKRIRINPDTFTAADVLEIIRESIPRQIEMLGLANNEEYENICEAFRQAGIPLSDHK